MRSTMEVSIWRSSARSRRIGHDEWPPRVFQRAARGVVDRLPELPLAECRIGQHVRASVHRATEDAVLLRDLERLARLVSQRPLQVRALDLFDQIGGDGFGWSAHLRALQQIVAAHDVQERRQRSP